MEGDGPIVTGVVKRKDDLIIIDEHRVQEGLDQLLLTVDIRADHSRELMQEENDMFFLQHNPETVMGEWMLSWGS